MFQYTEAKPQCWRAVAVFDDRPDQLVYLHRSSTQIRAGYRQAFLDLFEEEEREHATAIAMQRWEGAADAGRWVHQTNLQLPVPAGMEKIAVAAAAA